MTKSEYRLKAKNKKNDEQNWVTFMTRRPGLRHDKYYPWVKMKVGDWFFVPYPPTKPADGNRLQSVRMSWQHAKTSVTWVPGLKKWKMHIVVDLLQRMDNGKGRLGVMVTRVK